MNGKGGSCIAKYGEGMYGHMSKLDRIMLKFRPIAPKPVPAGSGSGGSTSDRFVKCERSKRKYVRVNKKKKDNNPKRRSDDEKVTVKATSSPPPAVTLPLLPETPDHRKENDTVTTRFSDLLSTIDQSTKCSYNNINNNKYYYSYNDMMTSAPAPEPQRLPVPQVVSYVSVENVTDTWVDSKLLGCTEEEIMTNMMNDTCPWFVSDGQDRVVWTNKAYRQIAGVGNLIGEGDMAVVLVGKDKWARSPVTYEAFSCKVKVTFRAVHSHRKSPSPTLTLPCDGWRMEGGSCAWRLDVKAALSLGR
ncbi:hypothetical protein SSX86_013745 [Deinandra increscens subsp. villosa]|uniref:DUF7950 domain-containing protein n=1 Tax=Deinandra increscens subsp. villosa TaxID=3103831 RepID=A0AAP0D4Q9_9ASTR